MRIDPGIVEHEVGAHVLEQPRQMLGDQREIGLILEAGVEREVEVARLLAQTGSWSGSASRR